MAAGVFVKDIAVTDGWEMQVVRFEPGARFPAHVHDRPEFLFILEGELVQGGPRLDPGWASVAGRGSVDDDVYSDTGCVFVLVARFVRAAQPAVVADGVRKRRTHRRRCNDGCQAPSS
jgi:hypothetical protein